MTLALHSRHTIPEIQQPLKSTRWASQLKSDRVLFAVLRDPSTVLFCVNINGHTGGMYRQCEALEEHQSLKTWQETWDQRECEEQKLGSEPAASNEQN
ncbi:uncharacterized [Tachysurus ichikawai]